jgi:hypothetical protein
VSATKQVRYVPKGGAEVADFEYAQRFVDLAKAIEGCDRSEDVAVLLSTCRNHWMATNAVFLDLKRALGSGDFPDSVSSALFEIERRRPAEAIQHLDKAGEYLAYARDKLRAWADREELLVQLEQSVGALENISKARVENLLQEQRKTAPAPETTDHVKYLVLSEREEDACIERMRSLREVAATLEAICTVAREVATLEAARQGSLFEQEEETDRPPRQLVEALEADLDAWGLERGENEAVRFGEDPVLEADLALLDREAWPALFRHLCAVCTGRLEAAQKILADFRANNSIPPMPEPYIVDLTPKDFTGTAKEYEIELHRAPEPATPNHAKVALLKWAIPESVFNHTELCRVQRPGPVDEFGAVIRAAVEAAAERDAAFLIMPELCVPEEMVDELGDLAEQHGVGIVAGREHWADRDARIVNEALIHVPRLARGIHQRKQEPSVGEDLEERFAADRTIKVIRGTVLGTVLVMVCSDYLEHDIVTRAWMEHHVDTLVVCSRNPNPDVFARLAMADAIREYCNVIVVNAFPDGDGTEASGEGTLVAVPRREDPLLTLEEEPLEVAWPHGPVPSLAIAELDMKAIFSRKRNRSDRGYLRPSRFATR